MSERNYEEFDWDGIGERIRANLEEILRPAVDEAISKRNEQAEHDKAEIDADAAARGMESSTYVTSMKARENENAKDDIADYETSYNSTLVSALQSTLMDAYEIYAQEKNAERDYELEREKLAQSQAQFEAQLAVEKDKIERDWMASFEEGSYGNGYEYKHYDAYLNELTEKDVRDFFVSDHGYWKWARSQAVADLGVEGYNMLFSKYMTDTQALMEKGVPEGESVK
ncbi:MAG: hypothetical protein IJO93_06330 [Clostridia bacterium]|nr:hypothetical protein [Clostridia bacterium]